MNFARRAVAGLSCLVVLFNQCALVALSAPSGVSDPLVGAPTAVSKKVRSQTSDSPPPILVQPPPASAPSPKESPDSPLAPSSADAGSAGILPPAGDDLSDPDSTGLSDDYIIGAGDDLLITDFSTGEAQPYTSPPTPVMSDGTSNIHPVGVVKVAGLTMSAATELVNKLAEKYIIRPDLHVLVTKARPTNVYIIGEVVKPGQYTNDVPGSAQNPVSSRSKLSLVSALQMAGGIKESADVRRIVITRAGTKKTLVANLWQLLVEGDVSQDLTINPGDVVFVPRGGVDHAPEELGLASNQHRKVRIWGYVKIPGLYDLQPDDDILSLIARAGGFGTNAITRYVTLSRVGRDGAITTRRIPVNKKRTLSDPRAVVRSKVQPGDLVIVHLSVPKAAAFTTYNQFLYVGTGTLLILFGGLINKAINQSSSNSPVVPVITPTTSGGSTSP